MACDYRSGVMGRYPHKSFQPRPASAGGASKALILEPGLLVADDPTMGVDVMVRGPIFDVIRDLQQAEHQGLGRRGRPGPCAAAGYPSRVAIQGGVVVRLRRDRPGAAQPAHQPVRRVARPHPGIPMTGIARQPGGGARDLDGSDAATARHTPHASPDRRTARGGAVLRDSTPATRAIVAPLDADARADLAVPDGENALRTVLAEHPQLEWVQLPWAGVDAFADLLQERGDPALIASGKGTYSKPVAEQALALTLATLRLVPGEIRASSPKREPASGHIAVRPTRRHHRRRRDRREYARLIQPSTLASRWCRAAPCRSPARSRPSALTGSTRYWPRPMSLSSPRHWLRHPLI